MTASSQNNKVTTLGAHALVDRLTPMKVKASTHVFLGALLALTLAGVLVPASADPSLRVVGYADAEADNSTGADGDLLLSPVRGALLVQNSASTDALTDADVGRRCYVVDDRTVARSSNLGARPVAGRVVGITSAGVYVEVGVDPEATSAIDLFLPAGADLSSSQYLAVVLGSGGTVTANSTAGGDCMGILQNAPANGAIAIVRVAGASKWITAAAVTVGILLESNNVGQAVAAVTGRTNTGDGGAANDPLIGGFVMGRALSAGGTAVAAQALVDPMGAIPQTAS